MKTLSISFAASAILAMATFSATAAGNPELVVNGSFEQTTLGASGALTNTNFPGWSIDLIGTLGAYNFTALYFSANEATTIGATGTDKPYKNWIMANAGDSVNGGKFVAIDGDPAVAAVLSQTINGLTVGHTYNLTFEMAGAQELDRLGPTTDSWLVKFGNESQKSTVLSNPSQSFTGWINQTMSFTATSTSQVLSFLAVGTPTGLPPVSLLDGVSMVDTVAAVPEPQTWALMLAGIGAIGVALRKRRSA